MTQGTLSNRSASESQHARPHAGNAQQQSATNKASLDWRFSRLTNELDFVESATVMPELRADTKEAAIRGMVARLAAVAAFPSDEQEQIVVAILRREELATTGIGRHVAIPHTKHPSVRRLTATIALVPQGIDFDAMDGEPVHLIVLLLSPIGQSREHLKALEGVARILQ
jgi:PTS system fructose-specific IIA component/PTS system nitrogen regulatory IIA component